MLHMTQQRLSAIQNRIKRIKKELLGIGMMRPGSLTKQSQRRSGSDKTYEYWQLSYTHKMKSRTDYVRPEMVTVTKAQVREFKKFKTLVEEWIDLAIEAAKLTAKKDTGKEENS
jgi:hypothetical protein